MKAMNPQQIGCRVLGSFSGVDGLLGGRGGPPPRGMDALAWEVRAGRLFVRWQDFKIGVETPSPVEV